MAYPETGEAPCGQAEAPDADHSAYTGNFKRISATDDKTVVFELCNPDVAFLSKIAFTSFAINDTAWLESKIDPAKADNQAIVSEVNGTGPYSLEAWNRGSDITMARNDAYWGDKAKTEKLIVRWGAEAAQRLVELQAGTADGIDNIGPTDFATVEGNADLQLKPREGLNTMYVGMNNTFAPFTDEKVRQAIAMGLDRQRIVDNFYPPGSEVASHFTPCAIPNGCAGDAWYEFDAGRGQGAARRGRLPRWLRHRPELPQRRARLPAGSARRGPGHPGPAQGQPGHRRHASRSRSPGRSWTTPMAACWRASTSSAGAPTIRTPRTSSTSTSGPGRRSSSATSSTTSPRR